METDRSWSRATRVRSGGTGTGRGHTALQGPVRTGGLARFPPSPCPRFPNCPQRRDGRGGRGRGRGLRSEVPPSISLQGETKSLGGPRPPRSHGRTEEQDFIADICRGLVTCRGLSRRSRDLSLDSQSGSLHGPRSRYHVTRPQNTRRRRGREQAAESTGHRREARGSRVQRWTVSPPRSHLFWGGVHSGEAHSPVGEPSP